MKAKKLLTALLALAMIFSLAACGKGNDGSAATPAPETPAPEATPAPEGTGDGSLQRVLDSGKLGIGAEGNWIPYVYNEDGTGDLTGFEVEIAKEVAARLGVEPDFQIADSWDPVMAGLDAGRYDIVICGVNPKPERQEKYAVSASYAENPFCLVVNGDNTDITSFEDLEGKLCINSPSSTAGQIAQSFGAQTADGDLTGAMEQLNTGRADAHVNNLAAVEDYMSARPEMNVKVAAIFEPAAGEEYMIESAAMLRKEDQELCDKVSEILQEMIADGTCYDLTVKYFGQAVADNTSLYQNSSKPAADDGSLQRVLDSGKLGIGAEGNWIPYVYNEDGTGDLTGFEVEIAKEVAARLGVEPDFQIADSWDPVMAGLDAGRYDIVICGVNPKPERQEKYAVTASYAENPFCLVVNGDNTDITSFEDLEGKLCINSPSSTAGQIAQSFGAQTADGDLTGAMEQLNTGRADGHVNNVAAVDEYMAARPEINVKIAAIFKPAAGEEYMIESAAMLRKEDQALCDKVSEILQEMIDDGTCYDLTVKYFGQTVADSTSLYQK